MRDRIDGACVATVDGLRVVLRPGRRYVSNRRNDTVMYFASAEIDPNQLPAIRDLWLQRLSTPGGSASLGWAVAATAVLPAWYVLRKLRSLRHYRAGLCPSCNYNLTGNTSGVCPECGRAK